MILLIDKEEDHKYLSQERLIEIGFETGNKAVKEVESKFNGEQLECEKIYNPFLLLKKKKYGGVKWTESTFKKTRNSDGLDYKGIEIVRRDFFKLVTETEENLLDIILIKKNNELAKSYLSSIVQSLVNGDINIYKLIKTGSISKKIEDYVNTPPHVALAKELISKDIMEIEIGSRIQYVIVKKPFCSGKLGKEKTSEKAELPQNVLYDRKIQIDYKYYLECLEKPIKRILKYIIPKKDIENIFNVKTTKNEGKGLISTFFTTNKKCKFCDNYSKKNSILCKTHNNDKYKQLIISDYINKHNYFTEKYRESWTTCQNCCSTILRKIDCSESECEIFYSRQIYKDKLKDIKDEVKEIKDIEDIF